MIKHHEHDALSQDTPTHCTMHQLYHHTKMVMIIIMTTMKISIIIMIKQHKHDRPGAFSPPTQCRLHHLYHHHTNFQMMMMMMMA